jgi:phosphoribosylformylglycinamidine cyclo-ligase
LLKDADVCGFAHITGGGLTDNVPRLFDDDLAPRFSEEALDLPPLFDWLQEQGKLSNAEMRRTFNCGVGGVLLVKPRAVARTLSALKAAGETAFVIGDITES